jgi:glycosyltransferase involved in cell wall biosynthesis
MPVKNAGTYLKPCLDSILAQTYSYWELVAVNDGSTDGSETVLEEYAHEYDNINVVNSDGVGIVPALQMAYKLSKGGLIHRMDADDLMPANKLELMAEAMAAGSVVTGKVSYFCDERDVGEGFQKYTAWLNALMEEGDFWRDVYRECPVPSSAWMMHRSDFERIGGFTSGLMPEDYDLAFRILKHKLRIIRLNEVVHHWRDSKTRTSRNKEQYFPIAYLPLKVHYFLELQRDHERRLVLWGAGKKGKLIARILQDAGAEFSWCTGNQKKIGVNIYGVYLQNSDQVDFTKHQAVIAISSPTDKAFVNEVLSDKKLEGTRDYWWFC